MGWSIKNSSTAVGLSYSYGRKIVKKYNECADQGVKNLKYGYTKQPRGKEPLLNDEQLEKLAQALNSKPSDGGIWSGPKVARWMEDETGVEKVWNQRGWDYLKKLKYSWQSPRPRHTKASVWKQQQFKQNLPQLVKKLQQKHPQCQVELWFFDEHRVGLKPILKKGWSPVGTRPMAMVNHRYEWLYVYGFVKPKTGETLWYLILRVNTQWLNLVYENFAVDAQIAQGKKVLLVEDNAGWHRSKFVKVPEGITVEFLPAYSPELQPAERLWKLVDEPLINQDFETIDEIEELLVCRCNVLREMRAEIKDLTDYHWLSSS